MGLVQRMKEEKGVRETGPLFSCQCLEKQGNSAGAAEPDYSIKVP